MDATNFLNKIRSTYSAIQFESSDDFRWSPADQTVYMGQLQTEQDQITLLHEIGHALSSHTEYDRDIKLLTLEREAWTAARDQAPLFNITITDDAIEDALDTYRDWLHARSRCPECSQTGIQRSPTTYGCLVCRTAWRVNDARRCELRRYRLKPQKTPA